MNNHPSRNPYRDLALHLSPNDIPAGEHQIDCALLQMERNRAQAYNIQRLSMILGPVLLDIGALELLIRLPFSPIQLIRAELSWALISVPSSLALLIIGIGISILAIDLDERLIRLFPPARANHRLDPYQRIRKHISALARACMVPRQASRQSH